MRILLATEGGERGANDARFLSSVIGEGDHDVDMLYVQEVEEEMPENHYEIAKETQEKRGVAAPNVGRSAILSEMGEVAEAAGMEVSKIALKGDPAEKILEKSKEGYDLVVMGSGGRGIFTKEILGLVANRVVKETDVSILVVKGDRDSCERVLVCATGGAESMEVFDFTGDFFKGSEQDITVLHTMEQFPRLSGYLETVQDELQEAAQDFKPAGEKYVDRGMEKLEGYGLAAEKRIREGDFPDQILEEAREGNYDMVILGRHVLGDWFEKYWKGDKTVPIVRDLEQSFLLVSI